MLNPGRWCVCPFLSSKTCGIDNNSWQNHTWIPRSGNHVAILSTSIHIVVACRGCCGTLKADDGMGVWRSTVWSPKSSCHLKCGWHQQRVEQRWDAVYAPCPCLPCFSHAFPTLFPWFSARHHMKQWCCCGRQASHRSHGQLLRRCLTCEFTAISLISPS